MEIDTKDGAAYQIEIIKYILAKFSGMKLRLDLNIVSMLPVLLLLVTIKIFLNTQIIGKLVSDDFFSQKCGWESRNS